MSVFVTWSGQTSRLAAEVIAGWLPNIVHSCHIFISTEIEKGARWAEELARELEECEFGILCVTPENLSAPWLLFEAGAVSNAVSTSRVVPLLIGVDNPSSIDWPLGQFQGVCVEKSDMLKLVKSVNAAQGSRAIPEDRLKATFDLAYWNLEAALLPLVEQARSRRSAIAEPPLPTQVGDVLQETLVQARAQNHSADHGATELAPLPPWPPGTKPYPPAIQANLLGHGAQRGFAQMLEPYGVNLFRASCVSNPIILSVDKDPPDEAKDFVTDFAWRLGRRVSFDIQQ